MVPRSAARKDPDPEALEFVRFCHGRRRVGWPELYDEMCAVAGRGLFRGYGPDDLAERGVGFSLFDMPALAALVAQVVAEDQALRRPVKVTLKVDPVTAAEVPASPARVTAAAEPGPGPEPSMDRPAQVRPPVAVAASVEDRADDRQEVAIRFVPAPA